MSVQRRTWTHLEHEIVNHLKKYDLHNRNYFAVAVSGGLDSMVALDLLVQVKPQAEIDVLHFHHGDSPLHDVQDFRDRAQALIQNVCDQYRQQGYQIRFKFARALHDLHSEDDFRTARFNFFKKTLAESDPEKHCILATGHHQDDLLETRLLKMMRGCGSESLERFKFWDQKTLRPLIYFSRETLLAHAQHNNLRWVNDPTNADTSYLRNWIRNKWLPDLETFSKGAVGQFANSLDRLIQAQHFESLDIEIYSEKTNLNLQELSQTTAQSAWIGRSQYNALTDADQLRALARLLSVCQSVDFTTGHLKEIQKRLDKNQKDLKFNVARINWFITAQKIMIRF